MICILFQVDERAVLKHFNWPEQKADALREAAFGYCDLKKLESEASTFRDDARQHCGPALKKMQALLEKYANFCGLALLHITIYIIIENTNILDSILCCALIF